MTETLESITIELLSCPGFQSGQEMARKHRGAGRETAMDIEKFRTFISAARCGNFGEAAEELFLTASTVSKHISALEHELGVSLFQRLPKGVKLTEKGELCLQYAEKTVEEYDRFLSRLRGETVVKISTFPIHSVLLGQIRRFKEKYPDTQFQISTEHGSAVVKSVEEGRCEIGFVGSSYSELPSLDRHVFALSKRGVAVHETHEFAALDSVPITALEGRPICLLSPETGMYGSYVSLCRKYGFKPNVVATSDREDNLMELVREGDMISIFPEPIFYRFNHAGLKFVPFSENIVAGAAIVRLHDRELSPEAQLFWDFVVKNTY